MILFIILIFNSINLLLIIIFCNQLYKNYVIKLVNYNILISALIKNILLISIITT